MLSQATPKMKSYLATTTSSLDPQLQLQQQQQQQQAIAAAVKE